MTFHFVRHAQSLANETGIISSSFPGADISELGKTQLLDLRNSPFPWASNISIISSPFLRTLRTAQAINSSHTLLIDERIKELDLGVFDGKPYDDVKQEIHRQMEIRLDGDMDVRYGETGESQREYLTRAYSFLYDNILQDKDVIVVTHECIITTVTSLHHDIYSSEKRRPKNCEIVSLTFEQESLDKIQRVLDKIKGLQLDS